MKVLGVKIDNLTMDETLSEVKKRISDGKKFWISTPNPEIIVAANNRPQFMEILNEADISVPDGVGIVMLSKLKNLPIKERVAGADLAEKICSQAPDLGWKVFFLGGKEDVAAEALRVFKNKYKGLEGEAYEGPKLQIVNGELLMADESKQKEAIERINKYQPDIVFVAFGQEKQERWIIENLSSLKVKGAMVVGGAFDFYSGRVKRAPRFLRNLGLEWFWRSGN